MNGRKVWMVLTADHVGPEVVAMYDDEGAAKEHAASGRFVAEEVPLLSEYRAGAGEVKER